MTDISEAGRSVLVRWLALAAVALLPPGLGLIGVGALTALVLWQEGKAGIGLAVGMSLVALLVIVIVYAGL